MKGTAWIVHDGEKLLEKWYDVGGKCAVPPYPLGNLDLDVLFLEAESPHPIRIPCSRGTAIRDPKS